MEENIKASRINFNSIAKVALRRREKTKMYWKVEEGAFENWFLNLFRFDKLPRKYFAYYYNGLIVKTADFEQLKESMGDEYYWDENTQNFYERPCVIMWYSDYTHGKEVRYFETTIKAEDFYNILMEVAAQYNIPMIDFYGYKD